jgi:hypothetical protein
MKKANTIEDVFDQLTDWLFLMQADDWPLDDEVSPEVGAPKMTESLNWLTIELMKELPHSDTSALDDLSPDDQDAIRHRIVDAKRIAVRRYREVERLYPGDRMVMALVAVTSLLHLHSDYTSPSSDDSAGSM